MEVPSNIQKLLSNDLPEMYSVHQVGELYTDRYIISLFFSHKVFDIFDINTEKYLIQNKSFAKYWYIRDNVVLFHISSRSYMLIFNGVIFSFIYEHQIIGISNHNCRVLAIYTSKGTISLVMDKFGNYQMIEFFDYLENRHDDEDINAIMKNNKFRHIPCVELEL